VMALPAGIGQVRVYRPAAEANGRRLYALVDAVNQGGQFNGRVVDEAGNVYLTLEGYRTVALPGTAKLEV
jgi:hypothetical protein